MRIEPKAAFYNEETGAVQPWKDIEVTDSVGNALVSEGLAIAIAEGGGGGGLTPYTVTLAYAENVGNKYFYCGLESDENFGTIVESVINLSDKFYSMPSYGIEAGTYEILPVYEGGSGYFSCANNTGATITGDAAIVYDEALESYYVKVTGDCSITFTE